MFFLEDGDPLDQLGSLKAIGGDAEAADVARHINTHRDALLKINGDAERTRQAIERMAVETQAAIKAHKDAARMEWVPEGDVRDMDRRYVGDDGVVNLAARDVEIPLPDGTADKRRAHGLLTDPYPVSRQQADLQGAYAGLALAFGRARRSNANPWSDPLVRASFRAFHGAAMRMEGRTGAFLREALRDTASLQRAISNTSGSGLELIRVPQTSNIVRPYDLARRIPGVFRQKAAAAPSWKRPIVIGRALARKRNAVSSDDPSRLTPPVGFTSSDETLSIVDLVTMALVDTLWATDATTLLNDPMSEVRAFLARVVADTLEAVILHGDTAASHQDTLSSWTLGSLFTAGHLTGSDSPLKLMLGLRARAFDLSTNVAAGGTFDAADHYGALTAMGNWGAQDAVLTIWGIVGFYSQVLANSLFTTYDKAGPYATLLTGAMGKLAGRDVVISEMLANEYASTGLYTGSGTTNTAVYVNPQAFDLWTYDGGGDFDAIYPEKGAQYMGTVFRTLFERNCVSTEKPVAVLVNL